MDPNAPAQVMPEETKFVEVKANCFYVPHTLIGFFVRFALPFGIEQ